MSNCGKECSVRGTHYLGVSSIQTSQLLFWKYTSAGRHDKGYGYFGWEMNSLTCWVNIPTPVDDSGKQNLTDNGTYTKAVHTSWPQLAEVGYQCLLSQRVTITEVQLLQALLHKCEISKPIIMKVVASAEIQVFQILEATCITNDELCMCRY